jgi:hypothetical protein
VISMRRKRQTGTARTIPKCGSHCCDMQARTERQRMPLRIVAMCFMRREDVGLIDGALLHCAHSGGEAKGPRSRDTSHRLERGRYFIGDGTKNATPQDLIVGEAPKGATRPARLRSLPPPTAVGRQRGSPPWSPRVCTRSTRRWAHRPAHGQQVRHRRSLQSRALWPHVTCPPATLLRA